MSVDGRFLEGHRRLETLRLRLDSLAPALSLQAAGPLDITMETMETMRACVEIHGNHVRANR
jgi:hypothetical protein